MLGHGGVTRIGSDREPGPRREAIREALSEMLPGGTAISVWGLDVHEASLLGEEESGAVRRAVATRREEFARGRACARRALAELGHDPVPIPVGEGRAPRWPRGFVGSITHAGDVVAAAVARTADRAALGIDVELVQALDPATRNEVVDPDDRIAAGDATDMVAFSARESIFKALYPLTGVWMEFGAVVLGSGPDPGTLRARPTGRGPVAPGVENLAGGYRIVDGLVITGFWTVE